MSKARTPAAAKAAAAEKANPPVDSVTVTALVPITHDDVDYAVGEKIVMAQSQADPLLAVKAVALPAAE